MYGLKSIVCCSLVADQGLGELARTARSCTNSTKNSTTSERLNSVPLHCTWIERIITLPVSCTYNVCTNKETKVIVCGAVCTKGHVT